VSSAQVVVPVVLLLFFQAVVTLSLCVSTAGLVYAMCTYSLQTYGFVDSMFTDKILITQCASQRERSSADALYSVAQCLTTLSLCGVVLYLHCC
jgi:hypothetical protein